MTDVTVLPWLMQFWLQRSELLHIISTFIGVVFLFDFSLMWEMCENMTLFMFSILKALSVIQPGMWVTMQGDCSHITHDTMSLTLRVSMLCHVFVPELMLHKRPVTLLCNNVKATNTDFKHLLGHEDYYVWHITNRSFFFFYKSFP